jgi:hypothetical protein
MKIRLLVMGISVVPSIAFAHGGGLAVFFLGLPLAILAYLIASLIYVFISENKRFWPRVGRSLFGLPVWLFFYLSPWLFSFSLLNGPYEDFWLYGVPLILLGFFLFLYAGIGIRRFLLNL